MSHSTRVPRGTPTEQLDELVADHARLTAEQDQLIADNEQLRADFAAAKTRLRSIRHLATRAHNDGATVLRIDHLRTLLDAPPAQLLIGHEP